MTHSSAWLGMPQATSSHGGKGSKAILPHKVAGERKNESWAKGEASYKTIRSCEKLLSREWNGRNHPVIQWLPTRSLLGRGGLWGTTVQDGIWVRTQPNRVTLIVLLWQGHMSVAYLEHFAMYSLKSLIFRKAVRNPNSSISSPLCTVKDWAFYLNSLRTGVIRYFQSCNIGWHPGKVKKVWALNLNFVSAVVCVTLDKTLNFSSVTWR